MFAPIPTAATQMPKRQRHLAQYDRRPAGPDFAGAARYALQRLDGELSPELSYHAIGHTRDDVVPAAERLAALEGIQGAALLVLRTAAYFHDLGFVQQRAGHEAVGAAIAADVLPAFGYARAHIASIQGIIQATQLPQTPRNPLEAILADADLDVLGRDDFVARNQALRDELAAYGVHSTDAAWYRGQLAFLAAHRYHTTAARTLRAAGKQQNMQRLRRRLARCCEQATRAPQPAAAAYERGRNRPTQGEGA